MKKIEKNRMMAKSFYALVNIGWPLKKVRRVMIILSGLTHQEVAAKIGTSRQTVENYLNGERKKRKRQQRLAKVLGLPHRRLFRDTYGSKVRPSKRRFSN